MKIQSHRYTDKFMQYSEQKDFIFCKSVAYFIAKRLIINL